MTKILWSGFDKEAAEKQLQFIPDGEISKKGKRWIITGTQMVTKETKIITK